MLPIIPKAFAYITRAPHELLVFRHVHHPEAGIQVPAGTRRAEESWEAAALREAMEETGIDDLVIIEEIGECWTDMSAFGKSERHHRRFFHLTSPSPLPDRWRHTERFASDGTPHLFELSWLDLRTTSPDILIADHGVFAHGDGLAASRPGLATSRGRFAVP